MNRRELLKTAVALPLLQIARANSASAQAVWPARTISMIVPFPAGGQADLAARPVAMALEKILGKSVIVDNRAVVAGSAARSRPTVRPAARL
jgi:tripartite-type tricarboxylate transporter receptor subunit TctC